MAGEFKSAGQTELDLRIELGHTCLEANEAFQLAPGSIVTLDKQIDDPVDIYANDRLVARGQLLVIDGHFCVRITELAQRASLPAAA